MDPSRAGLRNARQVRTDSEEARSAPFRPHGASSSWLRTRQFERRPTPRCPVRRSRMPVARCIIRATGVPCARDRRLSRQHEGNELASGLRPGRTGVVQPALGVFIAPTGDGEPRPRRRCRTRIYQSLFLHVQTPCWANWVARCRGSGRTRRQKETKHQKIAHWIAPNDFQHRARRDGRAAELYGSIPSDWPPNLDGSL
jgi:hypothetical protein